jgi:PleD family two-component response regulator
MISDPELHRMKILVIDDDRVTVTLLERLLLRQGYARVLGITDSSKAMYTCASFEPDLILLDLNMPNLDGFALSICPCSGLWQSVQKTSGRWAAKTQDR